MGTISHNTMSLDGFVARPDDSIEWAFAFGEPTSLGEETMRRIGAIVAGRRWYELATERWHGVDGIYHGEWDGQVFVLTHRPAEDDDSRISFVSGVPATEGGVELLDPPDILLVGHFILLAVVARLR